MASLTHVCVWDNKGWKNISAEEAACLHPGGTVSAHSGLFMCELCGQYVLLTDGNVNVRHFRHSSYEKSKDCPERTFGPNVSISYNSTEHDLPVKIINITSSSFSFELGLIRIPSSLFSNKIKIEIKGSDYASEKHVLTGERINPDQITYVSIGGTPNEQYQINILSGDSKIRSYWPHYVSGIDSSGCLFDAASGKKLPYDADVVVSKEYYLLTRCRLNTQAYRFLSMKEICIKKISWSSWYVYRVCADNYNEDTARFFLDYHCRLSDNPISITPIWPIYTQEPYLIKHCGKEIFLHIKGNVTNTSVFPMASTDTYHFTTSSVVKVFCNSRQQLITAGRSKALKYSYFWKDNLDNVNSLPNALVTDLNNNELASGSYSSVPYKGIISINLPYDGRIIIRSNGAITRKLDLVANTQTDIDSITLGNDITINIGLDVVWQASFSHKSTANKERLDEIELLNKLQNCKGKTMAIPSSMGQIYLLLSDYPELKKWISSCKKSNSIDERAYKMIKSFALSKLERK